MVHGSMKRTFILIVTAALSGAMQAAGPPTVREAQKFIEDAEARLLALSVEGQRADWVKSTYITDEPRPWPPRPMNGPLTPPSRWPRNPRGSMR